MQVSPLASVLDPSNNFYLSYSSKLTALDSNSSCLKFFPRRVSVGTLTIETNKGPNLPLEPLPPVTSLHQTLPSDEIFFYSIGPAAHRTRPRLKLSFNSGISSFCHLYSPTLTRSWTPIATPSPRQVLLMS